MALMDFLKKQFIDIIQWTEDADGTLAWRFPMADMEIQNGASLTVRESQMALFVNKGWRVPMRCTRTRRPRVFALRQMHWQHRMSICCSIPGTAWRSFPGWRRTICPCYRSCARQTRVSRFGKDARQARIVQALIKRRGID